MSELSPMKRLMFKLIPTLMLVGLMAWCSQGNRGRQEVMQSRVELIELFQQAGLIDQPAPEMDLTRVARQAGTSGMNRVLYDAASGSSVQALKWLVKNGADPRNIGAIEDLPLLLKAAQAPRYDRLEYFMSLGLDPLQRSRDGQTMMHVAARGGLDERVLELLRSKGLGVTDETALGQQPIHFASVKSIPVLVAAGADIEAKDINGRTALHNAAFNGRDDIVAELLRMKASVYATDKQGRTPLHLASLKYNQKVVDTLVAAGAPQAARDHNNQTPSELAPAQRRGQRGNDPYGRL